MNAKRSILLMLTFVATSLNAGCGVLPSLDPRLSNGGGGDLMSASFKVVQSSISSLTQDEIQQLSDQVNAIIRASNPGVNLPALTDAQADVFVAFLKSNSVPGSATGGLNSLEDFANFLKAAADDPSIVVIPPGFEEAFGNQDYEAMFGSVFGGI